MALWDRFSRMVRANVGRFLDDPADSGGATRRLDQRMKELRARDGELKRLDEQIITLKGHATFLERKLEKLRRKEAELEAKARAASNHGAGMAATHHEIDLGDARRETAATEAELTGARVALERAEATKRAMVEEKATRLAAAQEALLEAEGAVPPLPADLARPVAAPPASAPGPAAEGPRIKVTPREATAAEEPEAPRKTIGPSTGGTASAPAPAPVAGGSAKTLGPDEVDPMSKRAPDAAEASGSARAKSLGPEPTPPGGTAIPPAEASPSATPRDGEQLLDELERLGKLLEAGAISAEEFAAAKKKLLG